MKPTKLTNFSYTFYGPMTRQLFELGDVAPRSSGTNYFGIGSAPDRALAIVKAIGGFRGTPAEAIVSQITERVQASLQPEWQQPEGDDADGTEMFCIIEVEAK
jgi:hypothetical protein